MNKNKKIYPSLCKLKRLHPTSQNEMKDTPFPVTKDCLWLNTTIKIQVTHRILVLKFQFLSNDSCNTWKRESLLLCKPSNIDSAVLQMRVPHYNHQRFYRFDRVVSGFLNIQLVRMQIAGRSSYISAVTHFGPNATDLISIPLRQL